MPRQRGAALTFSIAQIVAVVILGCSSFLSGWMLRRIQAKSREAALMKTLVSAQTSIPSLETNLRNRDQRIAALFAELTEWKAKVPTLEAAAKRKDVEVLAKDRELQTARTEINALKAAGEATAAAPAFIALPVAPLTETEAGLRAKVDALATSAAAHERYIAEQRARLDEAAEKHEAITAQLNAREIEMQRVNAEATKWQARVPKLVATIKARDSALAARDVTLAQARRNAAGKRRDARSVRSFDHRTGCVDRRA